MILCDPLPSLQCNRAVPTVEEGTCPDRVPTANAFGALDGVEFVGLGEGAPLVLRVPRTGRGGHSSG